MMMGRNVTTGRPVEVPVSGDGLTLPVSVGAELTVNVDASTLATAVGQTAGNASLASILAGLAALATAAKQDTGNTSLASILAALAALSTSAGQGTTNASLTSIDGHVDGLEASATSIDTKLTSQATAAKQDTGNTSLASILSGLAALATAAKQDTEITSLASIATTVAGLSTAAAQTTANTSLSAIAASVNRLGPLGPGPGSATPSASRIFGFAIGATTATSFDITGAAYAGLKTAIDAGKMLVLKATSYCLYHWGTTNLTIAAASTAASNPGTQGVPMFDGGESPERAPSGTTYLNLLGGPVAGTLYVYIAE